MSTSTLVSERQRAKHIIEEIIRQSGGVLASKAELVRIYWRAHLVYAESQPGYLSFWPLLKIEAGPTIQDIDRLLGELVAEGKLRINETSTDTAAALRLELAGDAAARHELPTDAVEAIQKGLSPRNDLPDLSDYSSLRSWNESADGEELNIYLDVIPEAEYADRKRRLEEMASALNDVEAVTV